MSATSQSQTAQDSAKKPKRHPEKKIGPFAAGIGVCVWTNTIDTENGQRTLRSVTINPRRYFDRETNEWRDAPSYNPADLPAYLLARQSTNKTPSRRSLVMQHPKERRNEPFDQTELSALTAVMDQFQPRLRWNK
jgi:hypothetical protein